ncbi:unnamed protein product [Leptosia nina]|uniref:Uncharacterized protein n=1 Tax=Leptosia nina TaxID=320188 RepID=A0AAV1JVF5_9NEOP
MGCSNRRLFTVSTQFLCLRNKNMSSIDKQGTEASLQSKRNVGNSEVTHIASRKDSQLNATSPVRQQDCCSLPEERRWYKIPYSFEVHKANLSNSLFSQNLSENTSYTRKVQKSRRSPIASPDSARMAPCASVYEKKKKKKLREVRCSGDKLVFLDVCKGGSKLCVTRPERPSSSVSRYFLPKLAFLPSEGISTPISDSEGHT